MRKRNPKPPKPQMCKCGHPNTLHAGRIEECAACYAARKPDACQKFEPR